MSGTFGTCGLFCSASLIASLVFVPSLPSPPPPVSLRMPFRILLPVLCATGLAMFSRLKVRSALVRRISSSEKDSPISSSAVVESEGEMRWVWLGADGEVTDRACKPGRGALVGPGAVGVELKELKAPGVITPGSRAGDSLTWSVLKPDWKDVTLALRVSDFSRIGAVCWS